MEKQSTNHGEGNPEAADRFNTAEQDFVNSPRGKQKVEQGVKVRPEEEAELAEAEKRARAHAKNDDSSEGVNAMKPGAKAGGAADRK